jgi:hypothetical protein
LEKQKIIFYFNNLSIINLNSPFYLIFLFLKQKNLILSFYFFLFIKLVSLVFKLLLFELNNWIKFLNPYYFLFNFFYYFFFYSSLILIFIASFIFIFILILILILILYFQFIRFLRKSLISWWFFIQRIFIFFFITQEIFVMRRNLFWSNKIIEKFSSFNSRKIDGVMFHIEWVNKSLDFGFIDFLLNAGFKFIAIFFWKK